MFGHRTGEIVAVADIANGSAGVALIETGSVVRVLALAREHIPLEERPGGALAPRILQALAAAGEKATAEYAASRWKGKKISHCVCIIGAPWTHSVIGEAGTHYEDPTTVTDAVIAQYAQQAIASQKEIESKNMYEASVVRVRLNGYSTARPVGKKTQDIRVVGLFSDCDARIKSGAEDTLRRLFPGAGQIAWRSSARAVLSALQTTDVSPTCLVAHIDAEASDLLVVHKGALTGRAMVEQGVRSIATSIMSDKPVEETLSLLGMLEKDQCESDACDALKDGIARAEPDLAHVFGETLAKLSAKRRVPERLVLITSSRIAGMFAQFFTRIDFTQFTVTTEPFAVSTISIADFPMLPQTNAQLADDPGFLIACALVNTEFES